MAMQDHLSHSSLKANICCLLFLLFAASPLPSTAQTHNYAEWENGVTERWWVDLSNFTKQEVDAAVDRWKTIEEENQRTKSHQWAGDYFIGSDTHGTFMRWSPGAGFIMAHVNKCAAQLMGLSYGSVVVSPASIQFIFEHRKLSSSHGHGHSSPDAPPAVKFIPVEWRGQHYLVEDDEMKDFGDYAAGLGEYNLEYIFLDDAALFFTRSTDKAEGPIEDPPQVPPGYESFIKQPIDATITSVGSPAIKRIRNDDGSWQYEEHISVTLNAGSTRGIKRGMYFHILSAGVYEAVKIIRVNRRSSRGVIVRVLGDNPKRDEDNPDIRAGWRLSTSPHKYFFYNS